VSYDKCSSFPAAISACATIDGDEQDRTTYEKLNKIGQGKIGQGKARQNKTRHATPRHDMTMQDRTGQDRTEQD
jgi:hypothetical protein